ncbi:hypothetical protein [Yoonia sp.]|jgi:hypothetical protein|uniref:hypothetical protein n=1 Tax=Yoonia sp. TaxID=2212373 RepID=UPI0025D761D0|nr:hypothetical protein [Yoonia sp.]
MEHITPFLAPVPEPDLDVIVLRCSDQSHFDPAPLNRLFAQKDTAEAEEVICRVLEDIAMRLDVLQRGLAHSDFAAMLKPARRIGLISDQIGLTEVMASANHVVTCLNQRDGVALEATVARLERSFDVAVSEVWNFRDR